MQVRFGPGGVVWQFWLLPPAGLTSRRPSWATTVPPPLAFTYWKLGSTLSTRLSARVKREATRMLPVFDGLNRSSNSLPQLLAASARPARATTLMLQRGTVKSRSSALVGKRLAAFEPTTRGVAQVAAWAAVCNGLAGQLTRSMRSGAEPPKLLRFWL